jgi:hypothetical protein
MIILGNIENFAIQIENPELKQSKVCIWLDGIIIGNYEEPEYLKYIFNQLSRVVKDEMIVKDDFKFEETSIDILVQNEDLMRKQVILSLGCSFDDFIIRVVQNDKSLYFFWKLENSTFYKYDERIIIDKNYRIKISKKLFLDIIDELNVIIDYGNQKTDLLNEEGFNVG